MPRGSRLVAARLDSVGVLYANDGVTPRRVLTPGPHLASDAVWFDLVSPTDAERAAAEHLTGLRVPSREEIAEIENSSRVFTEEGSAYLSMPYSFLDKDGHPMATAVGFVLSKTHLLTVRFETLPAFETFVVAFCHAGRQKSAEVFVGLAEAIVDRMADVLERVAGELARLSRTAFHRGPKAHGRRRADRELRAILSAVGEYGDGLGNLRDSVLGMGRMVTYLQSFSETWEPVELKNRLQTLRQDVASLNDYDQQLTNRINFLLDAVLGFINIEQNNGVRVLTIVSVVGIPPTFVVGLYGMNFKDMPELNWAYGYEFGWAMILLSIVIPLVWFKVKGWI
jgi:magnesium transporter